MPRRDKSKYTSKQQRKAEHIAEGYEERGVGKKERSPRLGDRQQTGRRRQGPDGAGRKPAAKKVAAKKSASRAR